MHVDKYRLEVFRLAYTSTFERGGGGGDGGLSKTLSRTGTMLKVRFFTAAAAARSTGPMNESCTFCSGRSRSTTLLPWEEML